MKSWYSTLPQFDFESLPSWERGLKSNGSRFRLGYCEVAPFMGAWIEIISRCGSYSCSFVAPFMGAWIEIMYADWPSDWVTVAPFMGAWIEIEQWTGATQSLTRRSLHGSVD